MEYVYTTENTCARNIKVEINNDIVTNIEFQNGGCSGNLKAIPLLVDGWSVDQIEAKCAGITCGRRPTSCADQLAIAVREAYTKAMEESRN